MYLYENLMLALESLKANKGRSILTMLGIIIGISSVIAILTVGNAMTSYVNDNLSSFGTSNIYFYVNSKDSNSRQEMTSSDLINTQMIENMEKHFEAKIEKTSLNKFVGIGKIRMHTKNSSVNVLGTSPIYQETNNIKMISGRYIKERDLKSKTNIAIISDEAVNTLFNADKRKALGSEIVVSINNNLYPFTIVGVYTYETNPLAGSPGNGNEKTTPLYIPLSTAESIIGKNQGFYQELMVQAKKGQDIEQVSNQINKYLNRYYEKNPTFEVKFDTVESAIKQVNDVMSSIKLAISVIAGISLLVGGIGVMNIMLVSVTERTREIGIRKALGATNNAIRLQFIVESIIVCLIGGLIGIILGGSLGFGGSLLMQAPTLPSIGTIIIAVTFSMAIGIFFGYYPANKAANLDPIDALRYE